MFAMLLHGVTLMITSELFSICTSLIAVYSPFRKSENQWKRDNGGMMQLGSFGSGGAAAILCRPLWGPMLQACLLWGALPPLPAPGC